MCARACRNLAVHGRARDKFKWSRESFESFPPTIIIRLISLADRLPGKKKILLTAKRSERGYFLIFIFNPSERQ